MTVSSNTPPFGFLEAGSATVSQNSNATFSGWAADKEDGSPVASVQIFVDGVNRGNATLNITRTDVSTALGDARYSHSGWTFTYNVGALATGAHSAVAKAFDSAGAMTQLSNTVNFTVAPNSAPFGFLENGPASVSKSSVATFSGWAGDKEDGAPIQRVEIRVDGVAAGNATLGIPRADVSAALGSRYLNSGWQFALNTSNLTVGTHSITVVGFDSAALAGTLTNTATLNVTANRLPFGFLENGPAAAVQNTNVTVSGWAADWEDGTPIAQVQIMMDGSPVGNATLGIARPDVSNAFGNPRFANAGWIFTFNIGPLTVGNHTITAVAHDSLGATTVLTNSALVSVKANTAPFGFLESLSGTLAQNSNLTATGWAGDKEDGSPVALVQILLDGTVKGTATLGLSRPDVAGALGAAYANSGWTVTFNLGSASVGLHTISVVAQDSGGLTTVLSSSTQITVH
jgi:hypothetical protein